MGNDIYENKRTLMLLDLIKKSSEGNKKLISNILNKKETKKLNRMLRLLLT